MDANHHLYITNTGTRSSFSLLPSPFSLPPSSPQLAMLGEMSTSEEEGEDGEEDYDEVLTVVDDIDLDLNPDDTINKRVNTAMADLEAKLRKILTTAEAEGIRLEESFEHFDKVNR